MIPPNYLKCRQPEIRRRSRLLSSTPLRKCRPRWTKRRKPHGFNAIAYRIAPIVPIDCRWYTPGANHPKLTNEWLNKNRSLISLASEWCRWLLEHFSNLTYLLNRPIVLPGRKTKKKHQVLPLVFFILAVLEEKINHYEIGWPKTKLPKFARGRHLVSRSSRLTHSPTLKMSSGTFATAMFSGVLNFHNDMPQ